MTGCAQEAWLRAWSTPCREMIAAAHKSLGALHSLIQSKPVSRQFILNRCGNLGRRNDLARLSAATGVSIMGATGASARVLRVEDENVGQDLRSSRRVDKARLHRRRQIPRDVRALDRRSRRLLGRTGQAHPLVPHTSPRSRTPRSTRTTSRSNGSRTAPPTSPTTASTAICTRAAIRSRSSGKATIPKIQRKSPIGSCTTRSAASPMCCATATSRRATASPSICR